MNRSDLVKALADRFKEVGARDADLATRLIFDAMAVALAGGRRIEIRNFGVLQKRTRSTTIYRNPRTGEIFNKTPVRFVRFKAGKELQRVLANSLHTDLERAN
jgi:integration host factor subunit beta